MIDSTAIKTAIIEQGTSAVLTALYDALFEIASDRALYAVTGQEKDLADDLLEQCGDILRIIR